MAPRQVIRLREIVYQVSAAERASDQGAPCAVVRGFVSASAQASISSMCAARASTLLLRERS